MLPSIYLNTILQVTETPFPDNIPDTGTQYHTLTGATLSVSDFCSMFVFNGINYPVALAHINPAYVHDTGFQVFYFPKLEDTQ